MAQPHVPRHSLASVAVDALARLDAIEPQDAPVLAAHGLFPGSTVRVESVVPLGGPVVVRAAGARVAIARRVAQRIAVGGVDGGR